MGLFIEYDVWDMALVLTIIEPVRAWEYYTKIGDPSNPDSKYWLTMGYRGREVEAFPIWDENIKMLASWKSKPTWKQLREVYGKERSEGKL